MSIINIVKNEIIIGIDKPLTLLQMTDTHLVRVSETESEERRAFADSRSALDSYGDLAFAKEYAKKTSCPLIHTGDLMDFLTPEAMEISKNFISESGALFVMGNHEQCYCPGNRFCESDYAEELKAREHTLDSIQPCFNNDIRFFCKEIGNVNIAGIDDGDYQITSAQLQALKQIVKIGKPIILFTHIPLYSEELYSKRFDCMIATPAEKMRKYNIWQLYEQTASPTTREAHEFIISCSNIKAVISGHMHFDFEAVSPLGQYQIVTDRHTLREITIR